MPVDEIIYPFFFECCQYTNDCFWEKIFENLAYGIVPYGTILYKNYIKCNYKSKEFSYKLDDSKDPKDIYNDIYDLFYNKLNLTSSIDKDKKKEEIINIEQNKKNKNTKWVNIRKKNTKDLLFELYTIRVKKKYNLSNTQAKNLLSFMLTASVFKNIKNEDIIYKKNNIQKINGIKFDKGKVIFDCNMIQLDQYIYNNINDINNTVHRKKMIDNWYKFLENLNK